MSSKACAFKVDEKKITMMIDALKSFIEVGSAA